MSLTHGPQNVVPRCAEFLSWNHNDTDSLYLTAQKKGFRHKDITQTDIHEIEISFWCQELSLPNHLKFYRKWLAGAAKVCSLQ